MALTFTSPTDDIIIQEGVFAYNYKVSSTSGIDAGQVVKCTEDMGVGIATTANDNAAVVGVAAYDVDDNKYIAVYGPGNIVRCKSSGAIDAGVDVTVNSLAGHVGVPAGGVTTGKRIGISLETVATDTQVKVLLT
jgi:hypothetical protein